MTTQEVAKKLKVNPHRVRVILRRTKGTGHRRGKAWTITPTILAAVKKAA